MILTTKFAERKPGIIAMRRTPHLMTVLTALILGLSAAAPGAAQSASANPVVPDAADILTRLERNQSWTTGVIEATLAVSNRFGVTDNAFTSWSRKGGDALIEITSGPDRGQKVLRQASNIYLFYPDADEVIWLKGTALRDSLMGSDFSYEDLTDDRTLLDRFSAELLGSETIDGADCWKLKLTAKSKKETYQIQEIWVDKSRNVQRKAILYSAAGKAIRSMAASDVREIGGRYLAYTTVMTDLLKKNTSTTMTITKAEIDIAIPDRYFNREELSW